VALFTPARMARASIGCDCGNRPVWVEGETDLSTIPLKLVPTAVARGRGGQKDRRQRRVGAMTIRLVDATGGFIRDGAL